MSFIAKSSIREVSARLDAAAAIGEYVRLEKKGGRYWGKCPFHAGGQEKTPSFKVDPDLKSYHCFGCGKGGGVINFVMEMEGLSFPEAVKALALKLGVALSYEGGPAAGGRDEADSKSELFELYRRVSGTFSFFLLKKSEGRGAFQYIQERGVSLEMAERFKLGFAPGGRGFLYGFLQSKGYSPDFLDKSGLFSSKNKGFPLFSGRLMFPIADRQGRVAAFGGRALPGGAEPKYINSPETAIYKKGSVLYGLDLAIPQIRRDKTVVLAEGYLDVIALHQAGVANAVAPLGTSFTEEQAKLLSLWAREAVLVFDSDEAGEAAVYKALVACRKNGLSCSVAAAFDEAGGGGVFSKGGAGKGRHLKDPAEILQEFGPGALNNAVKNAIIDFEYLIYRARSLFDTASPGGKKSALSYLFPYFEALGSDVERESCMAAAADAFGAAAASVAGDYSRRGRAPRQRRAAGEAGGGGPLRMTGELFPLVVAAVNPGLYKTLRGALEIKEFDDPAAKELFVALEECFANEEGGIDSLLARLESRPLRDFIVRRGASAEFKAASFRDPAKLLEDGIREIKKKRLKKRRLEIEAALRNCQRLPPGGGASQTDELLAEKMSVDSQIRDLGGI